MSTNTLRFGRRSFLLGMFLAPFAVLTRVVHAARKTVKSTVKDATAALVKEDGMMQKALKYSAEAKKAKGRSNPSSVCSNCMQYSAAIGEDGKDILVAGKPVGSCMLFDAGKGFVPANGWCMSWYAAPAA